MLFRSGMSNRPIADGQGKSKSPPSPGISAELAQLRSRVNQLETLVKESLSEKNQWNTEVRGWIGKHVQVGLSTSDIVEGKLLWMDRYTMCLETAWPDKSVGKVVLHKGAITHIRLRE